MRRIRFLAVTSISFILTTAITIFVPGSFLNRFLSVVFCTIFNFNSSFCTLDLRVESDRAIAFDSFNTEDEGHRGITLRATNGQWLSPTTRLPLKDEGGNELNFTREAQKEIERSDRQVDLKERYLDATGPGTVFIQAQAKDAEELPFSPDFYKSYNHFDNETFSGGSLRLIALRKKIYSILDSVPETTNVNDDNNDGANSVQGKGKDARQLLGQALHTLQDFYAHSNWVELGKTEINKDLGRNLLCEIPPTSEIEDLNNIKVIDFKISTDTPCSKRPDKKGGFAGDPTAVKKMVCTVPPTGDRSPSCTLYDDPGTLDPNLRKLTSGYFMGIGPFDSCNAPVGKTRHGSSLFGCPDGLNKDEQGRKGYKEASYFAEEASRDYIHQIIDPLAANGKFEAIKVLMGMKDPPRNPCALEKNQNSEECKQKQAYSHGEPHLTTFDGFGYNFQTVGEFTLVKSADGQFEVQSRHAPINSSLAVNRAVAMKVGSDRVALYVKDFPDADTSNPLRVNGKPTVIQGNTLSLPGGGVIGKNGSTYVVKWTTGESVVANLFERGMNISPSVFGNQTQRFTGLLGNNNGKPEDDLQTRNGKVLPTKSTYGNLKQVLGFIGVGRLPISLDGAEKVYFDHLYKEFGNSWRIKQNESLFDYAPGQTTESYTNPGFPKQYLKLDMLTADQIGKARSTCNESKVAENFMEACIFDVGFSGLSEFALAAAEINNYANIAKQIFPGLKLPTLPGGGSIGGGGIIPIPKIAPPQICLPFIGCH